MKLFLILILIFLITPELTLACGGLLSQSGSNVLSESLAAALIYEPQPSGGGRERLVIQLNYRVNQGSVQNFGWLMPVPGKPEVAPAPDELFSRLSQATRTKKNYLEELYDPLFSKGANTVGSSTDKATPPGGVTVVSQTRIGAFDLSVVSVTSQDGTASNALSKWATANGYTTTTLNTEAMKDYLAAGWFFVLAKLAPTESGSPSIIAGKTQPVVLTFDTPEPIYPWRLAAYGPDGTLATKRVLPTQLYVLQPDTKLSLKKSIAGFELRYAEQLNISSSTELLKDLPGENKRSYFLTSYNGLVSATDLQAADLALKLADNQTELGSGKLSGIEWVWAGLGTLLYAQAALLITLWILFTSDLIGIIVALVWLGLIAAFVIPSRPRPLALVALTTTNLVLGTGLTLTNFGQAPAILISILPPAALLVWSILSARKVLSRKIG
ncbi:MAG: DUF2330 domain-containing protein [Chloroflexota bacterium]|nr:DUF2330 domain-containing protein [Chloroflexota bacterium]